MGVAAGRDADAVPGLRALRPGRTRGPQDFGVLLDKTGELLRRDYDWSAEIGKITAPVLLVFADADAVRPAHIVEFYALLGGGLRDANWDGSLRPVPRWPCCRAIRTMTSSSRPTCRGRSSRSWTRPSLQPPPPPGP